MTVDEALPTLTEAEKAKAFDCWFERAKECVGPNLVAARVGKDSDIYPAAAIAHAIADRKPDLSPWTPGQGTACWFTTWGGEVSGGVWNGDKEDIEARDFGNVFRAPEDAEAHAARLRVFNRVCQMMPVLDWVAPSAGEVFRAMREYFACDGTPSARKYDAIREQLEKEGAL